MKCLRIRAAAILTAGILAASLPAIRADQTDPELDALFGRLQSTRSVREARAIEQRIWRLWLDSGEPTVNELIVAGLRATDESDYAAAISIFDEVVRLLPAFAEGWNRRATAWYLLGDYQSSLEDIERTLELEPRHFGALAGRGLIRLRQQNRYGALLDFEAALRLNPHSPGLSRTVLALREQLGAESL